VVKYLIIRFSSIGDIVLTTPVVRGLKEQVEGARVHYLTKKKFLSVIEANPYIDKIHLLDDNFSGLVKELQEENFDYIIDLHRNLRSNRVRRKLKRIAFQVDKLNWQKWLMVNFKKNHLPDKHIVDRYMETVKLFDVHDDQKGLDYFIPPKTEFASDRYRRFLSKGYIVLAIGANHNTKKMPAQKLQNIIEGIHAPVVVMGGKNEYVQGCELEEVDKDRVLNLCGKTTLHQTALIVKDSSLVISHDTGVMHMAAAFRKNILSIWGNTIPEFGMYPYRPGKDSRIFEVKGLSCRPCSKIGYSKCPKNHFKCMMDQNTEEIIHTTQKLYSSI
jgi:ADP-heptose:LPS heptosyltransferase